MRGRLVPIILIAFGACTLPPAFANDSTAELATGGLIFVHTPDVEMQAEDLFISTTQVRVRYQFFNHSSKDVTTLVAFPMPDITVSGPDDSIAVPTEDQQNILGFATKVDGVAVTAQVEQKVIAKGVDRTAYLRSLDIPLEPYLDATNKALDKLPKAKWADLIKLGLADINEYDVGKGDEKHLEARWTLKTTYYWQQTFPAGRQIIIEHSYTPSVGSSAGTNIGSPGWQKDEGRGNYQRKYCIDQDLLATLTRGKKAGDDDFVAGYSEQRVSYILKTGANWAGPIKDFRLTVDKGAPDNLISFCGQGVTKTSPTQFEIHHMNFTPAANFDMVILSKYKNN